MFKERIKHHSRFILLNGLFSALIAIRYFLYLPEIPTDPLALIFIVTAIISQLSLLAVVVGLFSAPLLWIQNTSLRHILIALVSALGISLLIIDTFVFAQYRFHINSIVVNLILAGDVVTFPLVTWVLVIAGIVGLFLIEFFTLIFLEKRDNKKTIKWGRKLSIAIIFCFLTVQVIHIWAVASAYQPVTVVKRYLPLFYPFTANSLMAKYGLLDKEAIEKQKALKVNRKTDLHYPKSPLITEKPKKVINIMFIMIDSWRFDTYNADNTPNIWSTEQAHSGVSFSNHISTGNATRTGIFGAFYGIPGTYWHGVLANKTSPVLMDRLQALKYEIGIFTSAQLRSPEFSQTVFANIKNLRMESKGNSPSARDADLTKDWLAWYSKRDRTKPAFSFLFYDSPHGYDFPKNYEHQYQPMLKNVNYLALNNETDTTEMLNRYKTSVHYTDSLIKQVFDKLKKSGDLESTLVIISGDHAQELNDNKLNFWGHNSNFTNAQVHVPFIMFGAGISKEAVKLNKDDFTSHEDIVPTLMKQYLGVTSNTNDYSVGIDLLGKKVSRDWVLSSNYSGYAIVAKESIIEIGSLGNYRLLDKTNRPIKDGKIDYKKVQKALEQISRFNKK